MSFLRWVIRPYLYSQYYFRKITKTGSFSSGGAEYIKTAHQNTGNFIKDGLFRHHVKQFHESSCSVASVAAVINSLLEKQGRLKGEPVTQHDLLENVRAAHWKERMGENGYKGRRGLPLSTLGRVVRASLDTYGISYKSIEIIKASKKRIESKAIQQGLRSHLTHFEKAGDSVLVAHFDQGSFLPELHIPHISPVGGYDIRTGNVTVLDVDYTQPYPYQVPFDVFYKGISYNYNFMFRRYGFAEGGYIFIQL